MRENGQSLIIWTEQVIQITKSITFGNMSSSTDQGQRQLQSSMYTYAKCLLLFFFKMGKRNLLEKMCCTALGKKAIKFQVFLGCNFVNIYTPNILALGQHNELQQTACTIQKMTAHHSPYYSKVRRIFFSQYFYSFKLIHTEAESHTM